MFSLDQGSTVGIYFINRPEWLIVDHACSAYSYVSVPLYDTLGKYSGYLLQVSEGCSNYVFFFFQ